jgi:succinoglycan biosynthesis protein ExoV
MILYYYKDLNGNFGDDLNPWIWDKLLPRFFDNSEKSIFVGIGTLLTTRLDNRFPNAQRYIIFGSGAGYGKPPEIKGEWDFICVRGPRTAKAMHLPATLAATDPAIFINTLYNRKHNSVHPISFMPHHVSLKHADWKEICNRAGINYIDPRWSLDHVMRTISESNLILAEAMHGAIAADALRKPWIPVRGYQHISAFKWHDWCESLELNYHPMELPRVYFGDPFRKMNPASKLKTIIKHGLKSIGIQNSNWIEPVPLARTERMIDRAANRLNWIAHSVQPNISRDAIFQSRLTQLHEKLEVVVSRYGH